MGSDEVVDNEADARADDSEKLVVYLKRPVAERLATLRVAQRRGESKGDQVRRMLADAVEREERELPGGGA